MRPDKRPSLPPIVYTFIFPSIFSVFLFQLVKQTLSSLKNCNYLSKIRPVRYFSPREWCERRETIQRSLTRIAVHSSSERVHLTRCCVEHYWGGGDRYGGGFYWLAEELTCLSNPFEKNKTNLNGFAQ